MNIPSIQSTEKKKKLRKRAGEVEVSNAHTAIKHKWEAETSQIIKKSRRPETLRICLSIALPDIIKIHFDKITSLQFLSVYLRYFSGCCYKLTPADARMKTNQKKKTTSK